MTDGDLLQRYVRGEGEALEQLVRRHVDLVYGLARRDVGATDAEDTTQAVFVLLMQKAKGMPGRDSLAGWLYRATRYCCSNLRKQEGRRRKHEREAAMVHADETGLADELPALVNGALARLGESEREVVLLRYLEGQSYAATGAALGISEEAARKRAERGLERLRGYFAGQGYTLPSMAVAGVLAGQAAIHAPTGLVAAVLGATQGTGAGLGVAGLVKGVANMMWWAKVKAAALVLVGTLVVVGAGAVAAEQIAKPKDVAAAPSGSATAPTSAPDVVRAAADEDETKAAGLTQLVRWDAVLNEAGAANVRKVGKAVAATSQLAAGPTYEALKCNAAQLRRVVRAGLADGTVPRIAQNLDFAQKSRSGSDPLTFGDDEKWFDYGSTDERKGDHVYINGAAAGALKKGDLWRPANENDRFERTGTDRMRLIIDHRTILGEVGEFINGRWESPDHGWIVQSILYSGEVGAGEAAAFLGKYEAKSGTTYYHLIVWEVFKAQGAQMGVIQTQHDAGWWCEQGPGRLRKWADAARLWRTQVTHDRSQVAARFEKKLTDDKVVRLVALCRPSQWPCCWWDAEGQPVEGMDGMIRFEGDPPEGLWALVEVNGKNEEYKLAQPTGDGFVPAPAERYEMWDCQEVEAEAKGVELGVVVGPWEELGRVEEGGALTAHGVEYRVDRATAFGEKDFLVEFHRRGVLDNEDDITPLGADGTKVQKVQSGTLREVVFGRHGEVQTVKTSPNFHGLALKDVRTYRIWQRKREWVTFDGFARQPKVAPLTVVGPEVVAAAEKQQLARAQQAAQAAQQAQRRAWAAIKPDRTTEMGTLRLLIDAVRKGDEAAVRGILMAQGPEAEGRLPAAVHWLVVTEAVRAAAVVRYGEAAVTEKLPEIARDFEREVFGEEWPRNAEGLLEQAGMALRKNADGRYSLDLTQVLAKPESADSVREMTRRLEAARALLAEKREVTVEEVRTALQGK